ncbi:hypothetical protein L208DRAFT_1359604 [Tricholoma matsutake]|nr:hypothetical protein L208DRAFT_1359604 [Tricholoma matsutake 945]
MLPVLDILHRGIVYSLVGLSVYGIAMSFAVHRDTLQRGRELMDRRVAAAQLEKEEEMKEVALAEAAQTVLQRKRP